MRTLLFALCLPFLLLAEEGGQDVEKLEVIKDEAHQQTPVPQALLRDALATDVVGPRPHAGDEPELVKIGFYVHDIAYLDDARQTFTAKVRVVLRWNDPRLAKGWEGVRQYKLEEIWNPLISFVNQRSIESGSSPDTVFVDGSGNVIFAKTFIGRFNVPLNLGNFPFDRHQLYIQLRSYYSPDEVRLVIEESLTGWADKLSIPDWIVSNGKAETNPFFYKEQKRDQSQFEFSFEIQRLLGFYLWKVIIPMTLIVFMSWGVFFIPPGRLEAQVGLSATAFLTLFAFQFVIASLLPGVSYLTRMDRFTMLCSLTVFFALVVSVGKSVLVQNDRLKAANVLDVAARFVFPVVFALGVGWAFWL